MQILLRMYGTTPYVWKQAKFNGIKFLVGGNGIEYTNIVAVENDNRKNYVICSACGEIVRNDPRKIAEHQKGNANWDKCQTCKHFYANLEDTISEKLIRNEDGTYIQKSVYKVRPQCQYDTFWDYRDIYTESAESHCKYCNCEWGVMQDIHDIFIDNPGVFDDIITVDRVLDVGYRDREKANRYFYSYSLMSDFCIYAMVNKMNIVDHFIVRVNGCKYKVFYSKRYDRLYYDNDNGQYSVFNGRQVGADAHKEIKAQIAKLYN